MLLTVSRRHVKEQQPIKLPAAECSSFDRSLSAAIAPRPFGCELLHCLQHDVPDLERHTAYRVSMKTDHADSANFYYLLFSSPFFEFLSQMSFVLFHDFDQCSSVCT